MRVQNQAIFMGDSAQKAVYDVTQSKEGQKSIFAGNRNEKPDLIAMRQQQARKQVMKIVGDATEGDRKLEDCLKESRDNLKG